MADEENEQSPFSRPSFIVAAVVVAALVVAGVVVGVNIATQDNGGGDAQPAAPSTASAAPSAQPTEEADGESVCDLPGNKTEGKLSSAPSVDEWAFQGTTAYPSSSEYGPAATDEAGGFKYCFQHSPEGAVYAAAYALAVATDPALVPAWIDYFAAPGPYRDQFLTTSQSAGSSETSARLRVEGFRLLSYDGTKARVDLGITVSSQNQVANASFIYYLVWSDGDWKIDTSTAEPGSFSTVPDLSGYVPWGE